MKFLLLAAAMGMLAFRAGVGAPSDGAQVQAKLEAIPMNEKVHLSEDEWRKILTPEQYAVLRERGTERAGTGSCLNPHQTGTFVCAACGNPLFSAGEKFESGTGWPSFAQAMAGDHIHISRDTRHGMIRDEVSCARCDSHLGHVFPDGPPPTGLRYCMNSVALRLVQTETATFAAGCFWGVQSAFDQTRGVLKTTAGYTGGHLPNPTYEQVCTHTTGHAEAVEVEFDPAKVSYSQLLDLFWTIHNPRQKGGQGPDIGDNYRSALFTHTPQQKATAEASKAAQSTPGKPPIATEIVESGPFYPAEAYHQHYKSASCRFTR